MNGATIAEPAPYRDIQGLEHFDKVIDIDQSPIGRTPRSNPATYTGVFTPVRELFAGVPESRARGYTPGRFSFNVRGGRCVEIGVNLSGPVDMDLRAQTRLAEAGLPLNVEVNSKQLYWPFTGEMMPVML